MLELHFLINSVTKGNQSAVILTESHFIVLLLKIMAFNFMIAASIWQSASVKYIFGGGYHSASTDVMTQAPVKDILKWGESKSRLQILYFLC